MKVFVFHLLVYSGLLTCSGLAERNGNLNQAMLVRAGRSSNDESRSRYAQNESFSDNLFVGAGSESQDSEPAVIDISSRADEAPKDDGGDKRFIVPSESDVLSVQSLRYKLETNAPPFFDFRSDVDRLLDALINPSDDIIPASEFEVENVVNQYLSILRDMYYVQFAQLCANSGHNYKLCRHHIDSILKECTAAMAAALPTPTPNGRVWSYQVGLTIIVSTLLPSIALVYAGVNVLRVTSQNWRLI